MNGLSVVKFWNIRPKLPFRFKVDFYTGFSVKIDDRLSYCVTSVNLPKMEGQISEGSVYLGNTIFTVPTWNIASRKLDITFEENDESDVMYFLDKLLKNSYGKTPYKITILIHQYDEKMNQTEVLEMYEQDYKKKPLNFNQTTGYVCHLTNYEEPQFKRDGQAAQITISASFIIDTIIENWDSSSSIIFGNTYNKIDEQEEYNRQLENVKADERVYGSEKDVDGKDIRKLSEFTSDNPNREENFDALRERMKAAGVDLSNTQEVIKYLMKEGYITSSYNKELNGLCATATYLVAALTSNSYDLGPAAGHGQEQDLGQFGYHKQFEGTGADELNRLVESGKLKEGDVINITYADNSKYGHAVTVIKDDNGKYGFVSDFAQNSSHGQSDESRVGSWYIQRNVE